MTEESNTPATSPTGEVAHDYVADIGIRVEKPHRMDIIARTQKREGILGTARPGLTDGLSGKITPETIVRHGGVEMPVRAAERLGLIKRDAQGEYHDASLLKSGQPSQEQSKGPQPEGDSETPEGEQQPADEARAMLPRADAEEYDSMLQFAEENGVPRGALIGEYLANPSDLPASVKAMARKHGLNEATLKGQVDRVREALAKQVASFTASQGVNYDELSAFEAEHVSPGDAKRARLRLALEGDLTYWKNLCTAYKGNTSPKNMPAGITQREARHPTTGETVTLVKIPGHKEMDSRTASRMGLI